jgi:hypothetical protein
MSLLFLLLLASPSAESLIQRAITVDKELTPIQNQYAYTEELRNQQVEKDGKLGAIDTKTFDVIFLEGAQYRKLILIDGKPLAPDKQKKVDQEMEKARNERRKARQRGIHLERSVEIGGLAELLKYFDNRVTGEETLRGHQAWVVESTPKRDYKPSGKQQEEIMSWGHKSWFDQQDGVQMQLQSTAIRDVNGFHTGSSQQWEYDKGSEDCWLLRKVTGNIDVTFYKMIHGHAITTQTMTNYKKFDVASTITTGDEVKK